jgi:hypothetical protein
MLPDTRALLAPAANTIDSCRVWAWGAAAAATFATIASFAHVHLVAMFVLTPPLAFGTAAVTFDSYANRHRLSVSLWGNADARSLDHRTGGQVGTGGRRDSRSVASSAMATADI